MSKSKTVTINTSELTNMGGADAADIGFRIAQMVDKGAQSIDMSINDDLKCPDPSEDDVYENNGIKFSKFVKYANNNRIAPSYFMCDDIDEMNKCSEDSLKEMQQGYSDFENSKSGFYDEKSNELHIPVESTYIVDERDLAALSAEVLNDAVNHGNGKTTVVLDGFSDKETYHEAADSFAKRYNDCVDEILKSQKVVPYHRGNLVNFYR